MREYNRVLLEVRGVCTRIPQEALVVFVCVRLYHLKTQWRFDPSDCDWHRLCDASAGPSEVLSSCWPTAPTASRNRALSYKTKWTKITQRTHTHKRTHNRFFIDYTISLITRTCPWVGLIHGLGRVWSGMGPKCLLQWVGLAHGSKSSLGTRSGLVGSRIGCVWSG